MVANQPSTSEEAAAPLKRRRRGRRRRGPVERARRNRAAVSAAVLHPTRPLRVEKARQRRRRQPHRDARRLAFGGSARGQQGRGYWGNLLQQRRHSAANRAAIAAPAAPRPWRREARVPPAARKWPQKCRGGLPATPPARSRSPRSWLRRLWRCEEQRTRRCRPPQGGRGGVARPRQRCRQPHRHCYRPAPWHARRPGAAAAALEILAHCKAPWWASAEANVAPTRPQLLRPAGVGAVCHDVSPRYAKQYAKQAAKRLARRRPPRLQSECAAAPPREETSSTFDDGGLPPAKKMRCGTSTTGRRRSTSSRSRRRRPPPKGRTDRPRSRRAPAAPPPLPPTRGRPPGRPPASLDVYYDFVNPLDATANAQTTRARALASQAHLSPDATKNRLN